MKSQGSLAERDILEVVQGLSAARWTGLLRLERAGERITIIVEDGSLVFASSSNLDHRLGPMLLRRGAITLRQMEDAVRALSPASASGPCWANVHWVLYNIPPDASGLAEATRPADLPAGTREGLNDWGRTGYGGPCPPIGRHRYFHKLYALDTLLPDLKRPTKAQLLAAMEGHVLAHAELIGTYQRRR